MRKTLLLWLAFACLASGQQARAQTAMPVVKAPVKVKKVVKKQIKKKLKKKIKKDLAPTTQQAPATSTTPQRVKSQHVRFQEAYVPSATTGVPVKKQIGNHAPARAKLTRIKHARQRMESATTPYTRPSLAARMRSARFVRQPVSGQRFMRQHLVASALTRVHRGRGTDYVVKPKIKRQERKASVFHFSRELVKQNFVPLPTSVGEREQEE